MTRLVLIRHGETDWNREGRYQGHADVPLNAAGRAQAASLAQSQRGMALDAIYTSDLQRAHQTAEVLAEATGAPLFVERRLREIAQGDWEGQLFADIQRDHAELLARRRREPLLTRPPGDSENVGDVWARLRPLIAEIHRRHPGGRIALVSHGAALAVLKVHILHLPLESVWDHVPGHVTADEIRLGPEWDEPARGEEAAQ
jgi:broad specificity phosphatase PhoE